MILSDPKDREAHTGPRFSQIMLWSMIPKSGNRFSEKIMLEQECKGLR